MCRCVIRSDSSSGVSAICEMSSSGRCQSSLGLSSFLVVAEFFLCFASGGSLSDLALLVAFLSSCDGDLFLLVDPFLSSIWLLFSGGILLQCSVPEGDLHCQCILSIFPASLHQFYANILVFVNINPFLYINDQFALEYPLGMLRFSFWNPTGSLSWRRLRFYFLYLLSPR